MMRTDQKRDCASPTASRRHGRLPACATDALGRPFLIPHSSFAGAFTLIEIMVVVAIMGIILAAGVPSLYGFMHKSGARKTMSDIVETCKSARQKAIMSGTIANLVIHPKDGTMEVECGTSGGDWGLAQSAKIQVERIESMMINNNSQDDFLKYDQVKVRFFPNGTSDEMVLVLSTDNGQMEGVSLELTTGLPIILNDAGVKALVH
jgi:type II secretion system protein H